MIKVEDLPLSAGQYTNNKKLNSQAITIWITDEHFYVEPNYKKSLIPTILKINRTQKEILQIKSDNFLLDSKAVPHYFSFFVGIIDINGKKILLVTEEAQLVCTISNRDIFKITKPIFLFYNLEEKTNMTEEEVKILINIVLIFQEGMYFSYSYNLTEPLHFIKERTKSLSCFNWAKKFQQQLERFDKMWSLPIIQGFVGKLEIHVNAIKIKIFLISRRSRDASGTHQYTTGLDYEGHAANFVETEQIVKINDLIFSFVQMRGSVPLYWSQNFSYGILSSIKINGSEEDNQLFFNRHIDRMKSRDSYEFVFLLNLLCQQNIQQKLIRNYQYLVKKNKRTDLHYAFFDMHRKCESKKFSNFNKFLDSKMKNIIQHCEFTVIEEKNIKKYEVLNKQKSIIRTNCLYCIDRTNIAQSRIAAFCILEIFRHLDVKIPDFDEKMNFLQGNHPFGALYRNLWADNGDYLSKQYMGTESTESYLVRKGKISYIASFDHGMTSIQRAFRNIRHQDEQKNKALEFITNLYPEVIIKKQ